MCPKRQEQVLFSFHFDHVLTTNITLNNPVLLLACLGNVITENKKRGENTKCWQGCGVTRSLTHCWWECELIGTLWTIVWQPPLQLNMCL